MFIANNHYEDFKKQTQEELKQTIDSLLEGDSGVCRLLYTIISVSKQRTNADFI